jgi:hypothetical protein
MKNEWIAASFGLPSLICKQHLGTQIDKANKNKIVDSDGDNVKSAAGAPGGSSMHVHQAMVKVVASDLRNGQNGHIMFKTGTDALSGAVSGNMESNKRLTQNILPDMIIRAQNGVTSNIMVDFKFLCSTSTAYQHGEGKFGGGVEVRQEEVRRNYRTAIQHLDLMENGNIPGTIGPARRSSIRKMTEVQDALV